MVIRVSTKKIPPFSKGAAGLTVWPFIFVHDDVCKDDVRYERFIVHENVHYKRQRNWILLPWLILYGISRKFRLNEEILAYKTEYLYTLGKYGDGMINKEYYYRSLSSKLYNNLISYDQAKDIVDKWSA